MRALAIAIGITVLGAAPSFAQNERGYLTGVGGFTTTPDTTAPDVLLEGGVRIAPHLSVFGDIGRFHNLQPSDVQPNVDLTTAASADQGLSVIGTGRVPAVYTVGGLRFEPGVRGRVAPYVLGGVGVAHLKPTAQFTYSSGALPDGTVPSVGQDVTTQLESAFDFTVPPATNALMMTVGGGVEVPLARHWAIDADYRYARIKSDTPLNANGATFGFGYRF